MGVRRSANVPFRRVAPGQSMTVLITVMDKKRNTRGGGQVRRTENDNARIMIR